MREPEMTQELQAELHQGVLVRFFGGFYVAADADGQEYTLRCPKKFRHQRLSPLVGDAVRFTPGQGEEEGWLVEIHYHRIFRVERCWIRNGCLSCIHCRGGFFAYRSSSD